MSFPAKVTSQLHDGKPWGGYNCWVASTRGLIAFASDGDVHLDFVTVRKRAGRFVKHPTQAQLDKLGPGNLDDVKRVLTHEDTVKEFKAAGLRPPKVRYLRTTTMGAVCSYLLKGYQAAVAINYGTIKALRPKATGDPNFNGNHSVRWYGAFDKQGKPKTDASAPFLSDQLDPLNDGRAAGIAKGPQRINRHVLMAAAGDVDLHVNGKVVGQVGRGNVLALVVKPAQRMGGQVVKPEPEPDLKSQLAAAKDRIADLEDERQEIAEALDDASAVDTIRQILSGVAAPAEIGDIHDIDTDNQFAADAAADDDDKAADSAKQVGKDDKDDD